MSDPTEEPTISPTTPSTRRDSLEKHLQSRPDARLLKDKGILKDTNAAPALQSAQADLERQRASDALRKGLETRSQREDLENRNILPPKSDTVAPGLQQSQKELQKHMRADSLDKALKERPKPGDLVKEGILKREEVPAEE